MLAIIVLNIDKKLWLPLELETINGRNISALSGRSEDKTSDIVLVLFDDRTKFLLRRDGIPIQDFEKNGRGLITKAIQKLQEANVKAIGINLNLSNPSSDNSMDEKLAKLISASKNIVLASSVYLPSTQRRNLILRSARSVGYGELFADYDNVVHKISLIDRTHNKPSFSYKLFQVVALKDAMNSVLKQGNEIYLRYPQKKFKQYSFIDLVEGDIAKSELKDKVVILGLSLKSKIMKDKLLSPFNEYLSDSEVQAVAVANLLKGSYLSRISLSNHPLLLIFISLLLGALFANLATIRSFLIGSAAIAFLVIFGQLAYSYFHLIVELIPFLLILIGNLVVGSLIFLQLNLQDRNIELENALVMLNKRTKELENSKLEIEGKNEELSFALQELNNKIDELGKVRKQISYKREEERKRIARELHDDTLARITDLKIHIESIIYSKELGVEDKKKIGAAIPILDSVTREVRRIINALRPSMLDNVLGLLPAIESLLDELFKRSGRTIQTKLNTSLSKLKLNDETEIHLYRIIQEALNNVYKHSRATKVDVTVDERLGKLLIVVSDNGVGLKHGNTGKGFGILDMKERAELISAKVEYLNKPGNIGTSLEIVVSLPADGSVVIEKKESALKS